MFFSAVYRLRWYRRAKWRQSRVGWENKLFCS